ncbi:MAG: tetratricopeptide repeat protein [Nitrospinae bacterium]|nr:tetratricopeptide repeat protein [Nitrospinota bacterium]
MRGFNSGEDVAPTQSRLKSPLFLLVLTGILFLVYTNGLNTPFQSDDERHIIINPNINNPEFYLNSTYITYRHINNLTFALNYQWSQQNPFGYHLFNLLIHICTVILVFFITSLTIKNCTEWGELGAMKIAGMNALVFGLHPIHTETITYISGRPGGLAALFFFFSLLLFLLGGLKKRKIPGYFYYFLALITFFIAVLCKETAVTLPVIMLLYDLSLMKGENWKPFLTRLVFYALFPILAILAYLRSPYAFTALGDLLKKIDLSLLWVQLDILKHPLKLFLFPINLTFEYDFKAQVMWGSFVLPLFLLAAVIFLVIKKFYLKSAILSFASLWFFITLAPTNSVMPRVPLFSERNLYIPYFGLSLLFSVILYLLFFKERQKKNWLGIALVLAIGLCFSSLAAKRNQAYASPSSLWADTFEKTPKKISVGKTLSIHYLMEEKYPEALKTLNALLKINPGLYDVHQNMGLAYKSMGDLSNAEKKFKDAIQIKFNAPEAHYNLASLYGKMGKAINSSEEFDVSAKLFKGHINPPPPNFYSDKARAHNQAGIAYINAKKYVEALNQFQKSVNQNPNSLEARFNLARLLLDFKNDKQQAASHLKKALQLNPTPQQTQVLKNLLSQIPKK